MATKYYEVDIKFVETGNGQAEIVMPKMLKDKAWRFVQVNEGAQTAIIQFEATTEEFKSVAKDETFSSITDKKLKPLQESYPKPRIKRRFRPIEIPNEVKPEEAKQERTIETIQQVRWKYYIIDVPVQT